MRRVLAMVGVALAAMLLVAAPASAKGFIQHAHVTLTGPGLPDGGVSLGSDGGALVLAAPPWQEKWDAPNIGGSLRPNVGLGTAWTVHVSMRCEEGGRGVYDETLYPNVRQGPQLFLPSGITVCGDPSEPGYVPLAPVAADLLSKHGIVFDPPSPAAAVRDEATSSVSMLAVVGVSFGLALIAGEEVVRRRRRRT
jgi:hypothetical protein